MKKLERKDFLKIAGGAIGGSVAGYVFSGAPFLSFQWLVEWTQDQYVPLSGLESYAKSVCDICPNQCTLSIRMIGARAVKIETTNGGCPFGQNALQMLNHPERIKTPMKNTGKGKAKFEPVSWEVALKEISAKVNGLVKSGKNGLIANINKEKNLTSELLDRLVGTIGSSQSYYEASLDTLTQAAVGGTIDYKFDDTDYILSFGARLLEGWGNTASITKSSLNWKKNKVKFVQVDANCTRTASMADEWVNIKPGTELFLALGIANVLTKKKGKSSGGADFAAWSSVVAEYTPENVQKLTGVDAKKIEKIADEFASARRPIAVAGRGGRAVSSSAAEIIAVYGLNMLVNSGAAGIKGVPSLGTGNPLAKSADKKASGLDEFIKSGKFEVLFVNGADPVYKSVYGKELAAKMEKAFVVAITPLINDTAVYADYILPTMSFLEAPSAADKNAAVKASKDVMHAGDALLKIAQKIEGLAPSFTWKSYTELVALTGKGGSAAGFSFKADQLKTKLADLKKTTAESKDFPFLLIPIEAAVIGDGDGLAFPYAMKALEREYYSAGKLIVQINRETAKKHGISQGESLAIKSERGKISSVRAHLSDIIAPDAVAIPMGFGHKFYTKYAEDKGVNPKEVMDSKIDAVTGNADWWLTRVKLS